MGEQRFGFALQGLRVNTYTAYLTAPPQNCTGNQQLKIMQRAIFKTVRCMRSAFPLDAGLSASVRWRAIPCVHKKVDIHVLASTIRTQNTHSAIKLSLEVAHKVFKLLGCFILCLR
jgi:hypothetical protein